MKEVVEYKAAFIVGLIEGFILWVALIILKAAGAINMGWRAVASGFAWLPCIMFALALLTSAICGQIIKLKNWRRHQKVDARIIRQAKAAGVWNTNAGGRALELYAKEQGIKKHPGESDPHLRARIKEKAEAKGR